MTAEYKSSEVTFKYYLPENQDELWMHVHTYDMYSILYDIHQVCRTLLKHGNKDIKDLEQFAEKIRNMIHMNIDIDRIK